MASRASTDGDSQPTEADRTTPIEADADPNSQSDYTESTDSLRASILNYPMENGRRYHKYREGSYIYPNDDAEAERLDLQYELLKKAFGGRAFFAPLTNPKKILDIGTGTGIWPIDMADIFPECEITGTDLSPIQPDWVPDNVHFLVDDATEDDWLYPEGTFDFIHTRILLGAFEDFRQIVRKAFKYTKPGGYVESQELFTPLQCDDGTMPPDFPVVEWTNACDDAGMRMARPLRIANKLKRWYTEAGFEDVHEQIFKVPLNPWPRDAHYKLLGQMMEVNITDGLQSFTLAPLHRALGWSQKEIEVMLVNVRNAVRDRSVHAYYRVYVVWGRKPMQPSAPSRSSQTSPDPPAQKPPPPLPERNGFDPVRDAAS
ncbi:MAG: hypothetical protein M1832_002375 [Thelocarpon impressellum]|nr:MAG: hypothetical protein M1832_002375 [Thelocarpon impressellum]